MITLLVSSAIYITGLQASITAPTNAFRGCLREAASKAKSEKVTGDGIEAYLRNACTVPMGSLKDALIAFRMKNGMSRKAAADDASMTVDDYVATPADNYKFLANSSAAPPATPAASAGTPPATPASAPSQPPKP